jgi:hypothetical protein
VGVNAALSAGEENAAGMARNESRENYGEVDCTVNRVRMVKGIDSLLLGAVDTVWKIERVADLRGRPPKEKVWEFLRHRRKELVDGLFPRHLSLIDVLAVCPYPVDFVLTLSRLVHGQLI